ncbi:MAG: hypothetical protein H6719_36990 [Sandaracinaceae bacterium]|nr:hypothetical protein [Sandaracinaceae bacterium]
MGSETAMVVGAPETFGDITVQRLDFTIAEGTLTVEVGRTTHEYVIDPAWDRGELGPAVNAWTTVESYWSCSFTDADVLEVESRAPVFELSWDGGRAVLPTVPGRFFRATDEPRELRVGHVSCLGYTHPTRGTRVDADEVTVTALYPDGSRRSVVAHRPIEPVPVALAPPDDPAPRRSGWLALVAVVVVVGAWAARASLRSTR